jgi:small GTP-binding protein
MSTSLEDDDSDDPGVNAVANTDTDMSHISVDPVIKPYVFQTWQRKVGPGGHFEDEDDEALIRLKVTIVGAGNVGKTFLLKRFAERRSFEELGGRNMTVRSDIYILPLTVSGKNVLVHVWDTPGQAEFLPESMNGLREAHGIILAFDAQVPTSIDDVAKWTKCIDKSCDDPYVLLLATRSDTYREETRSYLRLNLPLLAEAAAADFYASCSSKTNPLQQIDQVILRLIDKAVERKLQNEALVDRLNGGGGSGVVNNHMDTIDLREGAQQTPRTISKKRCLV